MRVGIMCTTSSAKKPLFISLSGQKKTLHYFPENSLETLGAGKK